MAEFDFDELDKAVNDLMSTVEIDKRNPQFDDPEDKVVTLSPSDAPKTSAEPAVAQSATPVTTPVQATQAPTSAPSSLATKRRGQFMDIMSPSQAKANKPAMASRQGVTIQPSSRTSAPTVTTEPVKPEVPAATPENTQQNTWPDPIDMTTSTVSETPTEAVTEAVTEATDDVAPLTTPFLADAKVEKRPLGNNGSITIADTTEEAAADAQVNPTVDAMAPVVLPEELAGDVMAVESNDLSSHMNDEPHKDTPSEDAKPDEETKIEAPMKPEEAQTPVQEGLPEPTGPASIAQQYTEQPSTGDQSNGSIYDTSTYHQAIGGEATPKKHSSLKWVILIAILLILGAAGGAAAFYFTR